MTKVITFPDSTEAQAFSDLWWLILKPSALDDPADITTTAFPVYGNTCLFPTQGGEIVPQLSQDWTFGADESMTSLNRLISRFEAWITTPAELYLRLLDAQGGWPYGVKYRSITWEEVEPMIRTEAAAMPANREFGTWLKPLSPQSDWNSRPKNPVLGTDRMPCKQNLEDGNDWNLEPAPNTLYRPTMNEGVTPADAPGETSFASTIYVVRSTDQPQDISPMDVDNKNPGDAPNTVKNANAENPQSQPIEHPAFPPLAQGSAGSDGHCDVIDATNNRYWSFFRLRNDLDPPVSGFVPDGITPLPPVPDGKVRAEIFDWGPLDGDGWATPGDYRAGTRAAALPYGIGVVRTHEADNEAEQYEHALALSAFRDQLAPAYVEPCTDHDFDYQNNVGAAAYGERWMLPATFDMGRLKHPRSAKLARTLMKYGGFFVDSASGTPLIIQAETGANNLWKFSADGITNDAVDRRSQMWDDLEIMLTELRRVEGYDCMIDGNGVEFVPDRKRNYFSWRESATYNQGVGSMTFAYNDQKRCMELSAPGVATIFSVTDNGSRKSAWDSFNQNQRWEVHHTSNNGLIRSRLRMQEPNAWSSKTGWQPNGAVSLIKVSSRATEATTGMRGELRLEGALAGGEDSTKAYRFPAAPGEGVLPTFSVLAEGTVS